MLDYLRGVEFTAGNKLPVVLQTEAAECGLACLAMVAGYHGYRTEIATLRSQFQISLKGTTLATLMQVAQQLGLATRPVKLDLGDLDQLRLPCILHWNFGHFVVLRSFDGQKARIHDPAFGVRTLSLEEMSAAFTGVALELWPDEGFQIQEERAPLKLRRLMGKVVGLYRSMTHILLLALSLELCALLAPLYLQVVLDEAVIASNLDLLATLAIGFALLLCLQQFISGARSWSILYMSTNLNVQWRANVFSHLVRLPVQYFERRHLGDVLSRFSSVDQIQKTLTTSFLEAVLDGLMTTVTLIMMFAFSSTLAWVAMGSMALYAIGRWARYNPFREANKALIVHAAKQQSHFLETLRGVKAVKLFQRQDVRRSTWLTLLVDQVNAQLQVDRMQLAFRLLNGMLFGLDHILIVWIGAKFIIGGQFSVGALIAFIAYKEQFAGRVASLIDKFFEVKMLQLQGERLADIVFTEPESLAQQRDTGIAISEGSIAVRDLVFRYGDYEPCVLDGVSFTVEAGESVAIVGPSGCGKTTLINVLLGILAPTHGEVLVGGVSVRQVGLGTLRGVVGTVLQDDVLFAGSISDNISFFDPHIDHEWVLECARLAAVADEVEKMPMSYNTLVGDMGTVLSGGQKQRILLARALYKRPRILILDEATSHLDTMKEFEVNQAIQSLKITRIMIAHRPETIAAADRVLALEAGKVVHAPNYLASRNLRPRGAPAVAELSGTLAAIRKVSADLIRQVSVPLGDRETGISEDGLAAFGQLVGNAEVVVLGQQSYDDSRVVTLKSCLVRYLHERMGFEILAIDSSAFEVECARRAVDAGATHAEALRNAVFAQFSEAAEVSPLLDYLDSTRLSHTPLHLAGIGSTHRRRHSREHLGRWLRSRTDNLPDAFESDCERETFFRILDGTLENPGGTGEKERMVYLTALARLRRNLKCGADATEILTRRDDFLAMILDDLAWCERRAAGAQDSVSSEREQRKAEYLFWLREHVYRGKKIIVWGDNVMGQRQLENGNLGACLAAQLGPKLVSVGFTGPAALDSGLPAQAGEPSRPDSDSSFEAFLRGGTPGCCVVDLRAAGLRLPLATISSWNFRDYSAVAMPLWGAFDLMLYAPDGVPQEDLLWESTALPTTA
jgi:ATP-binding cassette subfamily B protein RaxB